MGIRKHVTKQELIVFFFKSEAAVALSFSASIALYLTYSYFFRIEFVTFKDRINLQTDILEHSAESPYRYRILIPNTSNLIMKVLQRFISYQDSFYVSHILINFVVIFLYLIITYFLLREFFRISISLLGLYILGFSLQITLQDHVYQPWSLLEGLIWTATFYLIARQKLMLLPILTIIASLNRETGIFIPIIIFLLSGQMKKSDKFKALFILLNFVLSIQIFVGLRISLGAAYENFQLFDLLDQNLQRISIFWAGLNLLLLFGFNWVFLAANKNVDVFWRKCLKITYIYIPFVLFFGVWFEVRLLVPILVILLSFILSKVESIISKSERTQF